AADPTDAGLGGQHHVVARHDVAEKRAQELLAGAVAVPRGGVDEGAAGLDEGAELVAGLVLVGVASPRERAQPQTGDPQTGSAERALWHGSKPRGHRFAAGERLAVALRGARLPPGRRAGSAPGAHRVPADLQQCPSPDLPRAVRVGGPRRAVDRTSVV